jgi:hypothetical protein
MESGLPVAGLKVSKEEVITLKSSVHACFWNRCVDALVKFTLFIDSPSYEEIVACSLNIINIKSCLSKYIFYLMQTYCSREL